MIFIYAAQQQILQMMKYLLTLTILLVATTCAPVDELVDIVIPGYTAHKWYSGYLNFNNGSFHYVFFDSQRDPDNDPVVLWLNGGPGCSSVLGMVYQNGPFVFQQGTANLQVNKYAWNMKANLLYITSPGGVGFSKKMHQDNNDGTIAVQNYLALRAFFDKFPNLKKNDFYITGQSYAGIYIPYLANEIITRNKLPETPYQIQLKGIMIGNACTDPRQCWEPGNDINMGIYQYENLYVHGYYTQHDYDLIKGACLLGYTSDACKEQRAIYDKKFYDTNTSMLNLYAKCLYQKVDNPENKDYVRLPHGKVPMMADNVICEDMYGITKYFNDIKIQIKYHVDNIKFEACSDDVAQHYTMFANASYWLYPILMKEQLRIWIYEGDVDNSVPITGTLTWINRLRDQFGLPQEEQWRQWWVKGMHEHEDQVAGMTWKLRGFTFASVKGAGHMVPKDKRPEAYTLFSSFINGVDLPDS